MYSSVHVDVWTLSQPISTVLCFYHILLSLSSQPHHHSGWNKASDTSLHQTVLPIPLLIILPAPSYANLNIPPLKISPKTTKSLQKSEQQLSKMQNQYSHNCRSWLLTQFPRRQQIVYQQISQWFHHEFRISPCLSRRLLGSQISLPLRNHLNLSGMWNTIEPLSGRKNLNQSKKW